MLISPRLKQRASSNPKAMLSFYVHIPYCVRRCGYCDFNTYTPSELQDGATLEIVSSDYIDAVLKELAAAPLDEVPTIFFGGGTPSLLPPKDLGRVISAIKERNGVTEDCEITLEANPDSVTQEKLEQLIAAGFNRISFGMQSSNPEVLKVLDRTHNPENVRKAVDMARAAGFSSVSVDLIYGSPGESLADWAATIKEALSLDIDHISAYALIVEEGTKLAAQIKRGEYTMPDDDLMADMYLLIDQQCLQKGLKWYELSNWSRPGHQCRHNIAYWKSNNWWGLGPGAHSHIDSKRFWNVKHPNAYKEKVFAGDSPIKDSEELTDDQRKSEYIMLALRMPEGVKKAALTVAQYERTMEYIKSGHVIEKQDSLALTPKGRLIADRLTHEMLR
jgi:putative oxygen-independent coproporphyrinogen III oxidase